jgi:hypothetical protein
MCCPPPGDDICSVHELEVRKLRNVTVDERELAWEPRGSLLSQRETTGPGYDAKTFVQGTTDDTASGRRSATRDRRPGGGRGSGPGSLSPFVVVEVFAIFA